MNEFTFLAGQAREQEMATDLLALATYLAGVPCSPLSRRHTSPDRELRAVVDVWLGGASGSVPSPSRSAARIPDLDLRRIERCCSGRIPAVHRDEIRIEARTRGMSVTIYECRAPWFPGDLEWTRWPAAQLRYDPVSVRWMLHWPDRNDRWHRYDNVEPGPVAGLLAEIDADPTCIFWG